MSQQKIGLPMKINLYEVKLKESPYSGIADAPVRKLISVEGLGDVGICSMEPGMRTVVFSSEEEDDGTAEHYYGPFNEYYYVICGEFAMYYGKDASKMREEASEKIILKPGDLGLWVPGWKYMCKNIGSIPGMYIYSMARAPGFKPVKRRGFEESVIHHRYPHLKRHLKSGDS